MKLALETIVAAIADHGHRAHVERLGGNVYGITNYDGLTLTMNDGQTITEPTTDEPVSFAIFRDGLTIASGEVWSASEARAIADAYVSYL